MFILQVILLPDRPYHENYLIVGKRLTTIRKAIAGLKDGIFMTIYNKMCHANNSATDK